MTFEQGLGLAALVLIVVYALAAAYVEVTNPCQEYRKTGGMTCYEITEGYTRCTPDRECVRRRNDEDAW